jgi:dolichyl-phosphate-mannose-protein mannosyltransferase
MVHTAPTCKDAAIFVAIVCAGFAAMLPISAAFVGTSMETFNRLMIFRNWI